jgi:hypothetical protein
MNGAPTSASAGSPLGAPLLETVTPRFVWFIALLSGAGPPQSLDASPSTPATACQPRPCGVGFLPLPVTVGRLAGLEAVHG